MTIAWITLRTTAHFLERAAKAWETGCKDEWNCYTTWPGGFSNEKNHLLFWMECQFSATIDKHTVPCFKTFTFITSMTYSCRSRSPPTFSEWVECHLLALGKFPSAFGGAWPDGLADEGPSERFTRRCQLCPQGWVDADPDGSPPQSVHCWCLYSSSFPQDVCIGTLQGNVCWLFLPRIRCHVSNNFFSFYFLY